MSKALVNFANVYYLIVLDSKLKKVIYLYLNLSLSLRKALHHHYIGAFVKLEDKKFSLNAHSSITTLEFRIVFVHSGFLFNPGNFRLKKLTCYKVC